MNTRETLRILSATSLWPGQVAIEEMEKEYPYVRSGYVTGSGMDVNVASEWKHQGRRDGMVPNTKRTGPPQALFLEVQAIK